MAAETDAWDPHHFIYVGACLCSPLWEELDGYRPELEPAVDRDFRGNCWAQKKSYVISKLVHVVQKSLNQIGISEAQPQDVVNAARRLLKTVAQYLY